MGNARDSPNQNSPEGGDAPLLGLPWGNPRVPRDGGEAVTDDREVDPRRERGWRYGEPGLQPISPPQLTADVDQLLSILTARLRMGLPISIPSVIMSPPERPRYLLSSGITRSSASRTITQRQWSRRVLSSH